MTGPPRDGSGRPPSEGPAAEIAATAKQPVVSAATVPQARSAVALLARPDLVLADLLLGQLERERRAFADGAEFGHSVGFEAGWSAAEREATEGWAREAAKIRRLAERDDPGRRVAAAEQYARALALRQYDRREAWQNAADAARVPLDVLTRRWRRAAAS